MPLYPTASNKLLDNAIDLLAKPVWSLKSKRFRSGRKAAAPRALPRGCCSTAGPGMSFGKWIASLRSRSLLPLAFDLASGGGLMRARLATRTGPGSRSDMSLLRHNPNQTPSSRRAAKSMVPRACRCARSLCRSICCADRRACQLRALWHAYATYVRSRAAAALRPQSRRPLACALRMGDRAIRPRLQRARAALLAGSA